MELWHLGICLMTLVIGVLLGTIVDLNQHDEIRDTAYKQGYRDGREDGRLEDNIRRGKG